VVLPSFGFMVLVPIVPPQEHCSRPRSSHSRAKYFRSEPLLMARVTRAVSTKPRGRQAETGTAICYSLGLRTSRLA
jgi:hypothetical protein